MGNNRNVPMGNMNALNANNNKNMDNIFEPNYDQFYQQKPKENKVRSSSTSAPSQMQEIIKNKQMTGNANLRAKPKETPEPEPVVFRKKIKNTYQYTHVGYDGEQDKANNQDISFIEKNFAGNKDYMYLSVCDGHGVEGHYVR